MRRKTRGEYEDEFTKAIIRFEKEYLGRGSVEGKTHLIGDMVLVRLRGILTPAEAKLSETQDGHELVKETRRRLLETSRPLIEEIVRTVLNCGVISFHTDMSTRTGERVIVLTLDQNLDNL